MKILSRTRGETEVYRGPPCPRGHNGIRYRSTGQCVACKRERGRKGSTTRGPLSAAVRNQARWVWLFEKNATAVGRLGIRRVLSAAYHGKTLRMWLYRMRTRWDTHPIERQKRLIALGEAGWWRRTDPPRYQMRLGTQVGTPDHKMHKKGVLQAWRRRHADRIRQRYRIYYHTHPEQRQRAAAARARRFKDNPGLAAYLTALRRRRERSQRCTCCTNQELRAVYLRHGAQSLDTDHKVSLAIAIERGLKGMHCVSNLQGLTREAHRVKTRSDIDELRKIRKSKGIPYHKSTRRT